MDQLIFKLYLLFYAKTIILLLKISHSEEHLASKRSEGISTSCIQIYNDTYIMDAYNEYMLSPEEPSFQ